MEIELNNLYYAGRESFVEADKLPRFDRAAAYAALNRINALYMIQRAGSGHIGSSFSSMEIITWMLLERPEIAFFSSKGHDCPALYATMISLKRLPFEMLHKLRRPGGLPGHPELKTPGIVASSGSLGMGISKAKGLVIANRLMGKKWMVAVLVGDGELEEGQNWEALRAVHGMTGELTLIVDNNKLSTEAAPQIDYICDKLEGFGLVVSAFDGHDFKNIERALVTGPQVIMGLTIKGKGISFLEGSSRCHSGALGADEYQAALLELRATAKTLIPELKLWGVGADRPQQETRAGNGYEQALYLEGLYNQQVVVLDADLAGDCGLTMFRGAYPERFIECGISEQDMVSQAGALASQGFIPIVHSFAAFLTRRANEQIYDNCCQGLRVIYVGAMAGRLPDGPGPSHEALHDVDLMRTMPNLEILCPRGATEVARALHYAVHQAERGVYIRLAANPIEYIRGG